MNTKNSLSTTQMAFTEEFGYDISARRKLCMFTRLQHHAAWPFTAATAQSLPLTAWQVANPTPSSHKHYKNKGQCYSYHNYVFHLLYLIFRMRNNNVKNQAQNVSLLPSTTCGWQNSLYFWGQMVTSGPIIKPMS